jgi:hypothetical protein
MYINLSSYVFTLTNKAYQSPLSDPLLMNAFNTVNLSSACILTTTEFAKQLEIPKDKWIYPLGGAGFKERDYCWFAEIQS